MKKIILLSCILILMPLCAFATTINVPGDQPTIQAGIDAAVDGDIVLLADGTYTGVGNYNVDLKGRSITVKSSGGRDVCIVDCQGLGRGFFAYYGGVTMTLEGLTVKNGISELNGNGGAVKAIKLVANDCIFENNQSFNEGGAVSVGSSAVCTQCKFTANNTTYDGGAINAFSVTLESCNFEDNRASYQGGAVDCVFFSFTNCVFTNNRASIRGGAVFLASRSGGTLTNELTNCILSGNKVTSGSGGAVYVYISSSDADYHSHFINCTFTRNNASKQGGAVNCAFFSSLNDPITFKNCIIWNNVANEGQEIETNLGDGSPVITYSDIKGGYTGSGNIDIDPLFLATDENHEFYLHPDSQCIDSGTNIGAPGDDIDGYIRPIGGGDDMGAYEYRRMSR